MLASQKIRLESGILLAGIIANLRRCSKTFRAKFDRIYTD